MHEIDHIEVKKQLLAFSEKYLSSRDETVAELHDVFAAFETMHCEVINVRDNIAQLAKAVNEGNKQKSLESLAVARAYIMDIENAYSNLADLMSEMIIAVRDGTP